MNRLDKSMRDLIRAAEDPTRIALAMAKAIVRHLEDVADDDPGDNDACVMPLVERAGGSAEELVEALRYVIELGKKGAHA